MSVEPWSKFFWSDYDADEGLRMCSLAAQGLWMRMLCLMARATPKGELRVGSEPCTVTDLARATGESDETVQILLGELQRRGVFSTTRAGVIFSRRLRKDAEISRKRAKSGALGAAARYGNQSSIETCDGKIEANDLANASPHIPEARVQSPERESENKSSLSERELPDWLPRDEWRGFREMRRKIKKPLTERAAAMAIRKLGRLRDQGENPADVLDQSTLRCWQDLYPVRESERQSGGLIVPC